ncbi:MAG TPA: ABC transporter permease [Bryobacteraceae bacterium]|nr:ABC transporter permease [Bryobacteraceae bacterium]
MAYWKRFLYKLRNFVRPGRAERDLAREIESHLELLEDDFRRRGMSAKEARLAAKRAYGGIEQAKELHREARSWLWLEQVRQDIRFSIRTLCKSPVFSLTAVLTLALGVGANTAIFSLIDALMLRSLPARHPEQLLQVNMAGRGIWGVADPFLSNPVWEQVRDRQDVFSGLFGYAVTRFDLSGRGEARYVQGNYVSGQFFETLGLRPIVGRVITSADDRRGCPGTALLSYSFWQSEYGGRKNVAGTNISLDNHPFEIVGVIGPGFSGVDVGRKSDIYVPLCTEKIIGGENGSLDLRIIGRPKPGLSMNQVEARLKTLAGPVMRATIPLNLKPSQQEIYLKRTFDVQMAANGLSSIRSKYRQALMVLMMIVGAILLIACSNVAHLLLARGAARQREIAIRMALGSGRGRLIRQLLIESLLLSFIGAALGIVFACWGARLLVGLLVSNVYHENHVFLDLSIDSRVLAFTLALAVLTGLLFGLVPAWRATRVDPHFAMKANARGLMQGGKFALGKALVVIQVALSLVLVAGAGLLLATFIRLETLDPGFERAHVLLMDVDLRERTTSPAQRSAVFAQVLGHLRALAGVRSASASADTPLGGAVDASYLQIDGETSASGERELVFLNQVSDRYFETLGTQRLAGRDFNAHDTASSPKVAIVTESFAKKYFHGQNPISRRYRAEQGNKLGDPVEIVGLVRDAKYLDLREAFHPTVYVAASQSPNPGKVVTFELRAATGRATGMIQDAKRAVNAVDAGASLQFRTLAGQVDESLARERMLATLSGFFGGLALLLAVLGLYGVISYNMAGRRNEIGIRMALGAQQWNIVGAVLGEVAILIGIGLAIGLVTTIGATHLIGSLLYGVKANDPRMLSLAAATLASVAAIAGFLPALRASRIDPMEALREE